LTGILFGMAPALRGSHLKLSAALKEGARSVISGRHQRLRSVLVVAELALSLVLLIGAGLLIRSFMSLRQVNPGFTADHVMTMRMSTAGTSYQKERSGLFYRELLERVRRLPGIQSAGVAGVLPLSGSISWGGISIEGFTAPAGQEQVQADQRIVGTGYFETMKVPLITGRLFNEQDTKDSQPVVLIDEHLAHSYFPNTDPVGKRLKPGRPESKNPWLTIVGVVGNVRQYDLETESRVAIYYPVEQNLSSTMYLAARTTVPPQTVLPAITGVIHALDPNVPVFEAKSLDQLLSESLARRRFAMLSLGLFAGAALVLAVVGIYGVVSYTVTQRTPEIGIRVALGAGRLDVLRLVLAQGLGLAVTGALIGIAASFAVARLFASLLFGVSATDMVTFSVLPAVLIVVALLASYIPARRATKVDPLVALRYE
jgi:predicted permease